LATYRILDSTEIEKSQLRHDEDGIKTVIVLSRYWIVQQTEERELLALAQWLKVAQLGYRI
jgi:hypothetical protein